MGGKNMPYNYVYVVDGEHFLDDVERNVDFFLR